MALAININDLLNKQKIESNRIKFKKGWNPASIYHSVCAFANDFDDLGGGDIVVGVDSDEATGMAIRPVEGIPTEKIDADIAHKDGSLKASKRGSLKTALQIINEIRNNPNVTLSEIAEKIGVSRRWIATNMKHLQNTGFVKRVGPNKGGHWEIIG